ncbi:MAG TPA: phage portal protein [Kofleriaceae bacterium]
MAVDAVPRAGGRSALAPKPRLSTLLQQAMRPDEAAKTSIDDILHGRKALEVARERCDEADSFYDGNVGMVWASDAVRLMLDRAGVEALEDFAYAHIPVDAIAKRLQISSVAVAPAEENADGQDVKEDAASSAAEKAIAKLRKDNELDAEEKRLHHEVSLYGEAYLFVWPVYEDGKIVSVDMRVNSAHNVIVIYDEEDPLRPKYALKSWKRQIGDDDDKAAYRATLYYPNRIERWTTEPGGNPAKEDDWYRIAEVPDVDEEDMPELAQDQFYGGEDERDEGRYGDDHRDDQADLDDNDIPNPWGRVPWFHFRNNRPVGIPEHRYAYGPQQLINKIVYALAGDVDFQSLPQKYILVDPTQDDPLMNLVDPDHPDEEDDDPENTGGSSGLRHSPGEIWRLFGKSVGQFEPGDPSKLIALYDRCVKAMAELTGMPQWAFSRAQGDMPSGESVRELNGDLNATVQDRRDRYDPIWEDGYEFALHMLGIDGVSVDVRWAPVERVNDLNGWQVIQAKIAAGVPPQVALEEAGYAPEQVEAWLEDATGADLGRRVALLGQIATATQALGASIVTGAVSAAQVQALISGLFGGILAGTDIKLPKADDFVDPQAQQQAQMQAQQDMQRAQLDHQAQQGQATREHATATQERGQQFQSDQAEAAHQRGIESFKMQQQAGGGQPRGPGGRNGRDGRRESLSKPTQGGR